MPTSCRAMRAALASTRFLASRGISCMANMMVTTSFENGSPYVSALPFTKVRSEWTNLAMPSMQSLVSTPVAPAGVLKPVPQHRSSTVAPGGINACARFRTSTPS